MHISVLFMGPLKTLLPLGENFRCNLVSSVLVQKYNLGSTANQGRSQVHNDQKITKQTKRFPTHCRWLCFDTISKLVLQVSSVQFSRSVVSDSLRPHESQHARPPCPSPSPRVQSDSRPSSQWCHPDISSSVIPFSSCPQSLPASESFPISQLFPWGG